MMTMNKKNYERKRVNLSLSQEDYNQIKSVAVKQGYTVTEFIKILALQGGKPKQPARKYGQNKILITLSDNDVKIIDQYSKENSTWRATLVKNIVLETIERGIFVPHSIKNDLERLEYLISNISNNINQMAHYSNLMKQAIDDRVVINQLDKLEDDIKEFIQFRILTEKNDN